MALDSLIYIKTKVMQYVDAPITQDINSLNVVMRNRLMSCIRQKWKSISKHQIKANLEKRPSIPQEENSIPQQSKYIDAKQRTEREKVVNDLFHKHGYLPEPTFKSSPILVSPLIQYEGFFDGASKNNPGLASVGYLLKYCNTTLLARGQLMGKLTNNQAELMSMGFLLAHSYCNGVQRLKVAGDSKIAIQFMKGNFTARHTNIIPLVQVNKLIANFFQSIRFKHVKRQLNFEANKLAADAFGKKESQGKDQ